MRTILFSAVVAAPACWMAVAQADCPTNVLQCVSDAGSSTETTTVSTRTLACGDGYSSADLWYDLTAGAMTVGARGTDFTGSGSMDLQDTYVLSGPVPGAPFAITARLRVRGAVPGSCGTLPLVASGQIMVRLEHPSAGLAEFTLASLPGECSPTRCCYTAASVDSSIEVQVHGVAGEPFTLALALQASARGFGTTYVTAELTFGDLPAGASLLSCQGFTTSGPTAGRRTSWGRLKARYH